MGYVGRKPPWPYNYYRPYDEVISKKREYCVMNFSASKSSRASRKSKSSTSNGLQPSFRSISSAYNWQMPTIRPTFIDAHRGAATPSKKSAHQDIMSLRPGNHSAKLYAPRIEPSQWASWISIQSRLN